MADWRDATGRRVRKGFHTREDATNYQASMRKQTLAEKSKARGQSAVIRSLMQSIKRSEKKKRAKEEVKMTVTLPVTFTRNSFLCKQWCWSGRLYQRFHRCGFARICETHQTKTN